MPLWRKSGWEKSNPPTSMSPMSTSPLTLLVAGDRSVGPGLNRVTEVGFGSR